MEFPHIPTLVLFTFRPHSLPEHLFTLIPSSTTSGLVVLQTLSLAQALTPSLGIRDPIAFHICPSEWSSSTLSSSGAPYPSKYCYYLPSYSAINLGVILVLFLSLTPHNQITKLYCLIFNFIVKKSPYN